MTLTTEPVRTDAQKAELSAELVRRAEALAQFVADGAAETERRGSVSAEAIEAFIDAGFFKILVPQSYGGYELGVDTMARVVRAIAPSCASTAWVLAFYIGHNWLHALFPEKSQDEVFGERSFALTPGTFAPSFTLTPTDGGYLASGRSSWNSGSAAAEWFMNGGLVKTEGQPPSLLFFLAPRSDVEVIENWDVAGLRGTASHDLALDQVFIPEHRTVDAASVMNGTSPGAALHDNPLYAMPVMPFIVGEILPVAVGTLRGAADEFTRVTQNRYLSDGSGATSKQSLRIAIGRGDAAAALADSMLETYLDMLGNTPTSELQQTIVRGRLKAEGAMITDFCATGVNQLVAAAGANGFRNSSPMQRYFRDINMMRGHATLDSERATESYGDVMLGLTPKAPV
ncbi:acyl-CoA dehydrogenase family protein [Rhodococcus sp. IEGM 1354]|uniref:acyl-CoA dehydrogenase family protein n=1 Tax=Rhodococcus sp. IEGM 1354 TaxID=3047088 RepID=UPI0024B6F329|nr:acyl-CoA dehydrogenase family protein [Rhodococcus sp. IEGM 1354]MDI9933220.1 acyl-CoA dehydrogenase family protein [Rhodococcus sp. IEGM 1354]